MDKTLLYTHQDCLLHDPGYGHPESPKRLQAIIATLDNYEEAPLATEKQVLLAHTPALLAQLKAASPLEGLEPIDADTLMSPASLNAALRGTGAACKGIDQLLAGKAQHVFCATRPPGHHACSDQAMGFCLFNHLAIAALYAQQEHGIERIALVDFDVHHGNGSQDILQGKTGLLYISTHQSPLYPGSGHPAENIPGNILNIPLQSGTGNSAYQQIFCEQVLPALESFMPQLLLVSAGFDAHLEDPLASLAFSTITYQWLGEQLGAFARQHCQSRMLSVLEGGYQTEALSQSLTSYLLGAESAL